MARRLLDTSKITDFFQDEKEALKEAKPKKAAYGMLFMIVAIISFILVLYIVMTIVRVIASFTV